MEKGSTVGKAFSRINVRIGETTSWLTLFMVVATFIIVVLRYAFDTGIIWLQESVTWMHAAVFMLGSAYTLFCDEHVRVDVFYGEMSVRRKAWVNALGVIIFLLPLCVFFVFESWGYVYASWTIGEGSSNSGGLPYPAIPMMKSMLLLMPLMIALQGISLLLTSVQRIRHPQ